MEQWLTPPLVISLAALALSGINSYYARRKDNKQEFDDRFKKLDNGLDEFEKTIDALDRRLSEAEASLKVLSKQMELFWRTVEQQMAKKFKDE